MALKTSKKMEREEAAKPTIAPEQKFLLREQNVVDGFEPFKIRPVYARGEWAAIIPVNIELGPKSVVVQVGKEPPPTAIVVSYPDLPEGSGKLNIGDTILYAPRSIVLSINTKFYGESPVQIINHKNIFAILSPDQQVPYEIIDPFADVEPSGE